MSRILGACHLLLFYWLVTELHFEAWLGEKIKAVGGYLTKHRAWYVKYGFALTYFVFVIWLGNYLHMTALNVGIPVASMIAFFWLRNVVKKSDSDEVSKGFHRYGRVLLFLCLLPFVSYDIGHHKAEMILKNNEYSYMVFEQENKKALFKFLGYINGHYFFIDEGNKNLVIDNKIERLKLRHYLKKGEKDSPDISFT